MLHPTSFRPRAGFWLSLLCAGAGTLLIVLAPWETVGAPILALLFFGGAALGLMLRDSPVEERRFVIRLFLVALAVRLVTALVFLLAYGGGGSFWSSDAKSYDQAAWVMARNWRNPASAPEGLGSLEFIRSHLYPRLLAGLYFIVGHSTAAAVIFNTVLGVSSVYLVYRLGVVLLGPAAARWAGWLAACYTGFWWWEMMALKDALFLFLILLFFLALHRCWNSLARADLSGADWVRAALWGAVMMLIFLGAGELREYVPLLLLCSALWLPVVAFLRSGGTGRWVVALAAAAAVVAVLWPRIMDRGLVPVAVEEDSLFFQSVELPMTENVAVFLRWVGEHPASFAQYMALAAFSSALAPYAWILPGTLPEVPRFEPGMIAFPGMWMWYLLIPFTILGAVQAIRRSRGEAWPVFFFATAGFLLFSFFIPRESRHRDIVMPFALMFAAEGIVYSRRWWLLGLLVWIPLVGFIAWKMQSAVPVLLAAGLAGGVILIRDIRMRRRGNALRIREG